MLTNPLLTKLNKIVDDDGDTYVEVERTPDGDTVYATAAGVDVLSATSSLVHVNPDQSATSFKVSSEDTENLFYVEGMTGIEGVSFGTDGTTFPFGGGDKRSRFLSVKPDAIAYNAGAFGFAGSDAVRATDVAFLRARGTWDSPTATQSGDWVTQFLIGAHDGTEYVLGGGFRFEVSDTVSTGVTPMTFKLQTMDSAGDFSQRWNVTDGLTMIGTSGTPNSGLMVNHSLAVKVQNSVPNGYTTDHDTYLGVVTTTADVTATLQTADRVSGRVMLVKDRSGNAKNHPITIDTQGSEKIDGQDQIYITENYGVKAIICGGSNWFTLFDYSPIKRVSIRSITSATATLVDGNEFVKVDYAGAVTLTLPSASSVYNVTDTKGSRIEVADISGAASSNNITVNRAGSDTMIGSATGETAATISSDGGVLAFQAIGPSTWKVMQLY